MRISIVFFLMQGLLFAQADSLIIQPLKMDYNLQDLFFECKEKKDSSFSGRDSFFINTKVITDINSIIPKGHMEKRKIIIEYEKGKKIKAIGYYDNGQKYYETNFNGIKINGIGTAWHKNGNKWTQTYYEDGKRIFPLIEWYENGALESFNSYDINANTGEIKDWYPNGKLKREVITMDTSKTCSLEKQYYDNGQPMMEFMGNCGKQVFKDYYDNGQLKNIGYSINLPQFANVGKWIRYYKNGQKEREYYYREDAPNIPEGTWQYWDEKGKLIKTEEYKDGKLMDTKNFLPNPSQKKK